MPALPQQVSASVELDEPDAGNRSRAACATPRHALPVREVTRVVDGDRPRRAGACGGAGRARRAARAGRALARRRAPPSASPGSRWSYSRRSAPQPAAVVTTQSAASAGDGDEVAREASARAPRPRGGGRARRSSPAGGTIDAHAGAREQRARCAGSCRAKSVSATQPVRSSAVPRGAPSGSSTDRRPPPRRRGSAAA